VVWSHHAHGRREDTKEDAGDEVEGKKTKRQAKNQVDGPSKERCRKEGETRQGLGRQGQMEISLQQSTQEIGNDLRKKKTKGS
jgi:hypothetical protein